jgi:large subunit ribosomal protein L13
VRTFSPKAGDIQRQWHVIDASDVVLGRLASHVAMLLRGKHKPIFAPHIDTGDFVIVVNASKVALSGSKLEQKHACRHSGYPGGLRAVSYASLMESHPERAVEKAVGLISIAFYRDPTDPAWKDDKAVKDYVGFMKKYYPDGNPDDALNAYGYSAAQTLVQTLKQCGDNLTRENVMREAANLKDLELRLYKYLGGILIAHGLGTAALTVALLQLLN